MFLDQIYLLFLSMFHVRIWGKRLFWKKKFGRDVPHPTPPSTSLIYANINTSFIHIDEGHEMSIVYIMVRFITNLSWYKNYEIREKNYRLHIYLHILKQSCQIQSMCPMFNSPYTSWHDVNWTNRVPGHPVLEMYFHQYSNRIKLFHFIY